jgi:plastocyanin
VAASPVVLAACGDDDGAGAEPVPDASDAATVTVTVPEFAFDPDPIRIDAGQSVVWENAHDQAHTATGTGALEFDTGSIAPGETSDAVLFADPGSFTYRCALHPFMQGTVEVG